MESDGAVEGSRCILSGLQPLLAARAIVPLVVFMVGVFLIFVRGESFPDVTFTDLLREEGFIEEEPSLYGGL